MDDLAMSMIGYLLALEAELFGALEHDPPRLQKLVEQHSLSFHGGLPVGMAVSEVFDRAFAHAGPIGCLWRAIPKVVRRRLLPGSIPPPPTAAASAGHTTEPLAGELLSLGKEWHLLHHLLTGTSGEAPPPAGDAILGGREVGDDLGYGPARVLDPLRVQAVAAHLTNLAATGILRGFGRHLANDLELYGADYTTEPEAKAVLGVQAERLVRFYVEAAARGDGVVIWIA